MLHTFAIPLQEAGIVTPTDVRTSNRFEAQYTDSLTSLHSAASDDDIEKPSK